MSDRSRGPEAPVQDGVRSDHRRLYGLLREAREAFDRGDDAPRVAEAFASLRRELEHHFEHEDGDWYGPLGDRHPELKSALDGFAREHGHFRRELAAIAEQIGRGDLTEASPALLRMALAFERHETAEEDLLRGLDLVDDEA